MKTIKETEFAQLEKGDIIVIGSRLEIVTKVLDHTFYSAPVVSAQYSDSVLKRSSHWVGSLDKDEDLFVFETMGEYIDFAKKDLESLRDFYEV